PGIPASRGSLDHPPPRESIRQAVQTSSPHFSHPIYCIGTMIRPDCATRKAGTPDPQAGTSVRGATPSGRPFRRFVTT
ncbi:MAG: hypothetical protein V3R83_08045, partial [Gammaproteobacteria bacterium]